MNRVIWSFGKHQRIQQHLLQQRPIHTAYLSFQNAEGKRSTQSHRNIFFKAVVENLYGK